MKALRQSTIELLGLGTVLEIFKRGSLPISAAEAVEKVFGPASNRGSMVISGSNGIVGAGKMMQLGSRLQPFGVPIVGLDFPSAPDGIGGQYPGLQAAFGPEQALEIMSNVVRLNYNGRNLPSQLKGLQPSFLLEAIPEVLEIKKAHYAIFRESFPKIEIRSVTSGLPSSELGVGIAHPAFPHQINKLWETVEDKPSDVTRMLWALGLIPVPVSDHWSFVLDVLFCGLTLAGLRYHRASNMPYWKIDKFIRKHLGPNPFRAHDAIGAKGANFLTWSCLHHLEQHYGALFTPAPELVNHRDGGQNWYPLNHFRPLVNWDMDESENDEFLSWVAGPMIQMTSLLVHEKRSHLALGNMIGESCAQFRKGLPAYIRNLGADEAIKRVEAYHRLDPQAAKSCWYPEIFAQVEESEWQQLYVNAEHDGTVGVVTISRESYNGDVDVELNRAIDWLKAEGIDRVILTADFHLSTQMVGADTSEFYGALDNTDIGTKVSATWSATARRFNDEFKTSVGYLNGKRCLGGMLELLIHCHFVVSTDDGAFGMPEVTLPVVPGMEGCHWPLRKCGRDDMPKVLQMLLTGKMIKAADAVGWLIDFAGASDDALKMAWKLASEGDGVLPRRKLAEGAIKIPVDTKLPAAGSPAMEEARRAIMACVNESCGVPLAEAISIQARHSADFMVSKLCRGGMIGSEADKILNV